MGSQSTKCCARETSAEEKATESAGKIGAEVADDKAILGNLPKDENEEPHPEPIGEFRPDEPWSGTRTQVSTCRNGHPLVPDEKVKHTCDIIGPECKRVGTSFRCASGCDFDVCDVCGTEGKDLPEQDVEAAIAPIEERLPPLSAAQLEALEEESRTREAERVQNQREEDEWSEDRRRDLKEQLDKQKSEEEEEQREREWRQRQSQEQTQIAEGKRREEEAAKILAEENAKRRCKCCGKCRCAKCRCVVM